MLHPSDDELAQAKALNIEVGNMNGPQLREAIRKAKNRNNPNSLWQQRRFHDLVSNAKRLGLKPIQGENAQGLVIRIELKIAELFLQKGIEPDSTVTMPSDYPDYNNQPMRIIRTDVTWNKQSPGIAIKLLKNGKTRVISAITVALNASLVEQS